MPTNGGTITVSQPVANTSTTTNNGVPTAQAALSITADANTVTSAVDAFSKTYDGAVYAGFTARYSGFVNNETAAVLGGTLIFSGAGTTALNASGPYAITPGGRTSSNYNISNVSGCRDLLQRLVELHRRC